MVVPGLYNVGRDNLPLLDDDDDDDDHDDDDDVVVGQYRCCACLS